jgi:ParB family chromosome partitioning protein
MTEAIVTEGTEKGEVRKICADPECPVHRPKKQRTAGDQRIKAEQEKQRREEAQASATGMRVLSAIVAAVPVRLTKRDLLFLAEHLLSVMEERRTEVLARSRGIKKNAAADSIGKLMNAWLHKSEEGELGRFMVEAAILLTARTSQETAKALKEAAQHYKVDTDAITQKVKAEFAAKEKARATKKATGKAQPKEPRTAAAKKAKAA